LVGSVLTRGLWLGVSLQEAFGWECPYKRHLVGSVLTRGIWLGVSLQEAFGWECPYKRGLLYLNVKKGAVVKRAEKLLYTVDLGTHLLVGKSQVYFIVKSI
jgi:hypothetical protein